MDSTNLLLISISDANSVGGGAVAIPNLTSLFPMKVLENASGGEKELLNRLTIGPW